MNVAQDAIERQTDEARFSAAVTALGGEGQAERVAGCTMLRRNVEDRLRDARNEEDGWDAVNLYQAAIDVFEN